MNPKTTPAYIEGSIAGYMYKFADEDDGPETVDVDPEPCPVCGQSGEACECPRPPPARKKGYGDTPGDVAEI